MRVPLFVDGSAVALVNYPEASLHHSAGHRFKVGDKTDIDLDCVMVWHPDTAGKAIRGYVAFPKNEAAAVALKTAFFKDFEQTAVKPQHIPAFTEAMKKALGA